MTAALVLSIVTATLAAEPISMPDEYPTEGKATTITLSGAAKTAETLRFTYQPDSHVVKTQTLETGGKDSVSWTPVRAGIVKIEAIKGTGKTASVAATKDVSVKFRGAPLSGLLIFVVAGLVLFGGTWLSMRLIFPS